MKTRVLDSWAILEWMSGRQPAGGMVDKLLKDAFAAMLAQKYNCPLITGDPEFRRVEELELDWIGG